MSAYLYQILENLHPCKEVVSRFSALPDCLADDYGACSVDEHAIYCPKYGNMTGFAKKNGRLIVDYGEEDVDDDE